MSAALRPQPQTKEACDARCAELIALLSASAFSNSRPDLISAIAAFDELSEVPVKFASAGLVECLFLSLQKLYSDCDFARSFVLAQRQLDYATALGDQFLRRRALLCAGVVATECGNDREGLARLEEAFHVAASIDDVLGQVGAMTNMACCLILSFDFEGAIRCSLWAAERSIGLSSPNALPLRAQAYANAADAALRSGDAERAVAFARQSLDALDDLTLHPVKLAHACLARALYQLRRRDEAISVARRGATELCEENPRVRRLSLVCRIIVELSGADQEAGLALLQACATMGARQGRADHCDALAFCVAMLDEADRPDEALGYLRELHDLQGEKQLDRLARLMAPTDKAARLDEQGERQLERVADEFAQRVARKEAALVDITLESALASGYSVRRPFRVARLAELFACHLHLPADQIKQIREAGFFIDIGMVGTPPATLLKRRVLRQAERAMVMEHVRLGARLVQETGLVRHRALTDVIRLHHERWDGTGPFALQSEEIPLPARVIAIADAFDAMTSQRPWRLPMSRSDALGALCAEAGTAFDGTLVEQFGPFIREAYWTYDDFNAHLEAEAEQSEQVRTREQLAWLAQRSPVTKLKDQAMKPLLTSGPA